MKNKPKKNTKHENKKDLKMEEKMSEKTIVEEKKNSNKTHISFAEYFHDDWREYFKKEEVVLKIIQAAGLTKTHDFVKVNTTYRVDNNRIALIILLRRKGTEILDKLIVDAVSGYPQFEQIMDVLYVIGSDADYHIILYDKNTRHHTHSVDGTMLTSLMELMIGCVFLTVMGIDLKIGDDNVIDFQCVDGIATMKGDNGKLPERGYLEKIEFWNSYFIPRRFQHGETDYSSSFPEDWEEDCDWAVSFAGWDTNGMTITYSIDEEILRPLLTDKTEEIKRIFEGCTIELEEGTTTVPLSHVLDAWPDDAKYRLLNGGMTICRPIPFRNFIYSLPEYRESLTEQFYYYAVTISYLEELAAESLAKEYS